MKKKKKKIAPFFFTRCHDSACPQSEGCRRYVERHEYHPGVEHEDSLFPKGLDFGQPCPAFMKAIHLEVPGWAR